MKSISPETLGLLRNQDSAMILLDVRSAAEFEREHAAGALSLPLNRVTATTVRALLKSDTDSIYVLCERGYRARLAIERLESEGLSGAILVEGGTDAWINAKLPVIRGPRQSSISTKSALAIEALLVAVGILLGAQVHVGFLLLFIGIAVGLAAVHDWRFEELFSRSEHRIKASS